MLSRWRNLSRVLLLGVAGGVVEGRETRTGWEDGKRHIVSRGAFEDRPLPDVLSLRDGTRLEVYFLETYGDRVVFFLAENERSWVREVVPRAEVAFLERGAHLERDPLAPPRIERALEQPVAKAPILAGVFRHHPDRSNLCQMTFRSEIDKPLPHSEDATDYGTFVLASRTRREVGGVILGHDLDARGEYRLFAPQSVGNSDWVLVLSEVIEYERDRSPTQSLASRYFPQETYVLVFSERRDRFRLAWSNISAGTWPALTQMTFSRRSSRTASPAPAPPAAPHRSGGASAPERCAPALADDFRLDVDPGAIARFERAYEERARRFAE